MDQLIVAPKKLAKLAEVLDELTGMAEQGTRSTDQLESKVWASYGVSSGVVNEWFVHAEKRAEPWVMLCRNHALT